MSSAAQTAGASAPRPLHLIYQPKGGRALRAACGLRLTPWPAPSVRMTTDGERCTCSPCLKVARAWRAGSGDVAWAVEGYTWEREAHP